MARTLSDRFVVAESRFGRVLLILMTLGFLSLIGTVLAAGWVTQRNQEHTWWVNHTYRVELTVSEARRRVEQAEGVRRGYLLATGPSFAAAYADAIGPVPTLVGQVRLLTRDNPRQQANLAQLGPMIARQVARQRQSFVLVGAGRRDEALALYLREVDAHPVTAIRARFAAVSQEERALLAIRDRDQQASVRTFYIVLAIAGVLLALVSLLSLAVVLRFTRDIRASRDKLGLLNDTLEEQVAERTADLSRANEEIQRFAYIVSHDLRSPLVNVMGFTAELAAATEPLAELVRRAEDTAPDIVTDDARLAATEDLPEAIGFIRTSTQKMDRLINAILRLSREGRRVIAPEPLEPADIVATITASMQHIIDERGVTVEVEPLPRLVTDRLALEQILSNLIENATKYLKPGRPGHIVVSGQEERGRVILSVADNGRGIDPRDHQRVFDLFRRSGSQDQPGEGIGLAHVRALAYRLGGTIDVASELGQGATFNLSLPATLDMQDSKS